MQLVRKRAKIIPTARLTDFFSVYTYNIILCPRVRSEISILKKKTPNGEVWSNLIKFKLKTIGSIL